ncbi:MAG: hypothetical protein COA74_14105 [Gammaproteobacteria bacterium]|nr:MAG: hypothetical protein COA74_14105 [Gammaproteobacteria bacterium]
MRGLLKSLTLLSFITSGYAQAIINGTDVAIKDWRSVVLIEFIDPDNGRTSTCTAVILSDLYAITTASCVLHEETAKQVSKVKICIGNKKPFTGKNQQCFSTTQIYSHHNFITNSGTSLANNLAYLKFSSPLDLRKLDIQPAILVTPAEFSHLVASQKIPPITWVGFDAKDLAKRPLGVKHQGTVENAEFDYGSLTIRVKSSVTRPGNHYQGMASFIKNQQGQWRLIGLVSHSTPDKIVTYYPEFNPCDEDPIPVKYPKPILVVTSSITAYPIAACKMIGFLTLEGYDELACKGLLQRKIDWSRAVEKEQPNALRQLAVKLYSDNKSKTDAGEIYKLLYQAQKSGDEEAGTLLSQLLLEDKLLTRDVEQARGFIEQLVLKNNAMAKLLLAKIKLFPNNDNYKGSEIKHSTKETDLEIFSLLESAANKGLAEAQYLLAQLYQNGIGVSESRTKAYHWFALSAQQGYADGQFQLGMQWLDGRAVKEAYPEIGLFWINQAAAQGQLDAQNYLGLLKPN